VEKDAEKCRPVDLPVIQSDIGKLKSETGFVLKYSILDTLKDTLDYWRSK
jgi:GDP-4-dehydro-6-deoxy-D-mannose reductase